MNRTVSRKSINESAKELNGESKKKNLRDASLQIGTSNRNIFEIYVSSFGWFTTNIKSKKI